MKIRPKKEIYLDYASGIDNPSAIHSRGVKAKEKVEKSRQKIAKLINAHFDEIIFTGSGTESIALAILSTVHASRKENFLRSSDLLSPRVLARVSARPFENLSFVPHVITTNIEHSAVLENCKILETVSIPKYDLEQEMVFTPDGDFLIMRRKGFQVFQSETGKLVLN